jgi:hypothetical protein
MAGYIDLQWAHQELIPLLAYAYQNNKQYCNRSPADWESDVFAAVSEIRSIVSNTLRF